MKFTDGNWLIRAGVQPFYPAEAHDVTVAEDSFTVYATRPIRHRGDTLSGPLLTVTFSSPMADVIRVRLTHFAGGLPAKPEFQLFTEAAPVVITDNDAETSLTSGKLAVHVPKTGDWRVEYRADGRVITSSPPRGMGIMEVAGEGHFMHEQLALGVGEQVYGLGERFTAFVKNGQTVELWNRDGGTSSDQAYKNIPFYLTNRGYGVFINQPEQVSLEVAAEKVNRVQFSVPGHTLEYLIIYGPTPKEILTKYTALTGRPARPPAWSFGLWLTTSFTTPYDEATVTSFIQGMTDRDLPLHVFHFDCFWMREFHWCDFLWDRQAFPDPAGMLQRLKARGLRICLWINPYIAQRSVLFAEGQQQGYLLKRPNGAVWQWDLWQPGLAVVDFTNPAARQWYANKLRTLLEMGVDCFKTDFGERIPTDVVYHDGSDPQRMHNYYSYLFNQTVFELLREVRGEGEAVVFARAATAGGQQFPVHWGGDSDSTFPSMAESLRGGLSLGLSGFGFWSHDIGGFEGMPDAELYKRWIAFGLLSSHSRLHGSSSYRVPWLFDQQAAQAGQPNPITAVDVLRHFTKLKCRLMPYLYAGALETVRTGVPLMRAMLVEFPEDPTSAFLDRQYMLGENLLVAPVFAPDGEVTYYVPAGHWTHFLTGEVKQGPAWVRETHDALSIPLLVRPNTVIAVGREDSRPDYDYADGVTLQVYALDDGATCTAAIPTLTGETAATFGVKRVGNVITVTCDSQANGWRLLLLGVDTVTTTGGTVEQAANGVLIIPSDTATLQITL